MKTRYDNHYTISDLVESRASQLGRSAAVFWGLGKWIGIVGVWESTGRAHFLHFPLRAFGVLVMESMAKKYLCGKAMGMMR